MRSITIEDIETIRTKSVWDLGNDILYEMCEKYPGHDEDNEIIAKIWLIGRSYAAAIERRKRLQINDVYENDDFYEKVVVPTMQNKGSNGIDSLLASINTDSAGTAKTIEIHKDLMDMFSSITGLDKRSLASKYLHFHKRNNFFIYDSRACQSISKLVPRISKIESIQTSKCDIEYRDFVRRCIWLRDKVNEVHGVILTPREIDNLLLMISKERIEGGQNDRKTRMARL